MTPENLRTADWTVFKVPEHQECVRMMERWHYAKGAPNTSTYRHGLYPVGTDDRPWGVALWIPPTKTAGQSIAGDEWGGVLSLSRFVLDPEAPRNAASFLLGRSMKGIDRERWPWLLTYADTGEGHDGGIYRATNWTCLGRVKAGDVWVDANGMQRGRKRGQRSLTRREMEDLGFTRKPSAPKIKYVHHCSATTIQTLLDRLMIPTHSAE